MTEAELASIENGFRWASPEHSVHRVIAALREARAEIADFKSSIELVCWDRDRLRAELADTVSCLNHERKAVLLAIEHAKREARAG